MNQVMSYRVTFMIAVFFGLFLLSQMTMFVVHQIWDVNVAWNVLQYCVDAFNNLAGESKILAMLANIFIVYTFVKIGLRLFKQSKHHKQWVSHLHKAEDIMATNKVRQMFGMNRLVVVRDENMYAIVFGLFAPRIAVSSAIISSLSDDELKAVLSHERYHCHRLHPLKMFILTVLAECFSYLPVFRQVLHYYKCWTEIEADRYAVRATGDMQSLGNALLKLVRSHKNQGRQFAYAQFADYAVNYRIKHLLVPDEPVRIRAFSKFAFAVSSIGVLALTSGMIGGCLL
ncbi:M56 family metallopeptidase [Paenibacillus antri]|uniref:M56 family metallopeptidase n=1 Tax=Paenibacillus antri TaxID=2582848 RepID=A0A5R9G4P9_9BACL|nr:M56 family metallopeptidase [Paenibacillus antri]TLS50019.1 M56 family metallopeptidase [Paenibacillus antri]